MSESTDMLQRCQRMKDTLKKWRRSLNRDLRREEQRRHDKLRVQLEKVNATKLGDMLENNSLYQRYVPSFLMYFYIIL